MRGGGGERSFLHRFLDAKQWKSDGTSKRAEGNRREYCMTGTPPSQHQIISVVT
jgi:hypothetical protein